MADDRALLVGEDAVRVDLGHHIAIPAGSPDLAHLDGAGDGPSRMVAPKLGARAESAQPLERDPHGHGASLPSAALARDPATPRLWKTSGPGAKGGTVSYTNRAGIGARMRGPAARGRIGVAEGTPGEVNNALGNREDLAKRDHAAGGKPRAGEGRANGEARTRGGVRGGERTDPGGRDRHTLRAG